MLVLAGHATASTTWTLNTGAANGVGDNPAVTATSTAWANTGSGSGVDTQALEQQFPTPTGANFYLYTGGLGINNLDGGSCGGCDAGDIKSTAPEHAIDNNQRYEMVLINFGVANVNISGVTYGWTGTTDYSGAGSETTVLAYTGSGTPTLGGQTWGGLSGWTKIGNYANTTDGALVATNAPASTYSSYWLIGAYNPLTPGIAGSACLTCVAGNDYVKLKSLVGSVQTSKVPEPGSLALVCLAFIAMLNMRQHREV